MTSGYLRLSTWAALAGSCLALGFVIADQTLASLLGIAGAAALAMGLPVLQVRAAVRGHHDGQGVLRPVALTTASICAGALPALFIVLGLGDMGDAFHRLRAPLDLGRPNSGTHLAFYIAVKLLPAASLYGLLVLLVALLAGQRRAATAEPA